MSASRTKGDRTSRSRLRCATMTMAHRIASLTAIRPITPAVRYPSATSPLIVVPPLLVYALAVLPALSEVLPAVASPTLAGVAGLLGTPLGAAAGWAHFIGFDLFVGRWMYLDGRERGVHALVMAPLLVLTILLGPLGMLAYLVVRAVRQRSAVGAVS